MAKGGQYGSDCFSILWKDRHVAYVHDVPADRGFGRGQLYIMFTRRFGVICQIYVHTLYISRWGVGDLICVLRFPNVFFATLSGFGAENNIQVIVSYVLIFFLYTNNIWVISPGNVQLLINVVISIILALASLMSNIFLI